MSVATSGAVRTFAFADLANDAWGAGWIGAPSGGDFIVLPGIGDPGLAAAQLSDGGSEDEWRLDGDGVELVLTPVGPAVGEAHADHTREYQQLCRVTGRTSLGADQAVDALGQRRLSERLRDHGRWESVRDVSAWFEPADGIAVLAWRPQRARGHETDLVAAALLGEDGAAPIAEARLSTTYTAAGEPARASLELWLGGAGSDDAEHESEYPRRAAGEALGGAVSGVLGELSLSAQPFRWHSGGREGGGVYLLARRR
jgi:hypothetical protein